MKPPQRLLLTKCTCFNMICIDRYTWQGTANLQQTVEHLRHQDLSQPYVSAQVAGARKGVDPVTQQLNLAACIERKEKSLGLLAQRFVQMLLCKTGNQAVALDDAAKSLLGMLLIQDSQALQLILGLSKACNKEVLRQACFVSWQHLHCSETISYAYLICKIWCSSKCLSFLHSYNVPQRVQGQIMSICFEWTLAFL